MSVHIDGYGWTIAIPDRWTAEKREEVAFGECWDYLLVTPNSKDASLRLTPDFRDITPAMRWVETCAQITRHRGRPLWSVRCGDFSGNRTEFASDGEWLRGWHLCNGAIPLDACYRCKLPVAHRDDSVVDEMLNTLRLDRDPNGTVAFPPVLG
jgi:hypothetical protein